MIINILIIIFLTATSCIAKKDESVLLIDNFFLRYSEKGVENALLQRK